MNNEKRLIWPDGQHALGALVIGYIRSGETYSVMSALRYELNLNENVYFSDPHFERWAQKVSVLKCAIVSRDPRFVRMLIDRGADVNYTGNGERSPLMEAVLVSVAMAELLISSGADVNYADASGDTALHYAARWQNACHVLVKSGAVVARENNDGQTALDIAQKYLNYAAYDYLLPRTRDASVLAWALDVAVALAPLRLPPYVVLEILDWTAVKAGRRAFRPIDVAEIKKVEVLVGVQRTQNRLLAERANKKAKLE